MWNRVITGEEVLQVFKWNQMYAPQLHWPFNEQKGTTIYDASGNGNDWIGGATTANHIAWSSPEWFNGALSFLGGAAMQVSSVSNFGPLTLANKDVTICLWYRLGTIPNSQ